jgi:hypothetical protein
MQVRSHAPDDINKFKLAYSSSPVCLPAVRLDYRDLLFVVMMALLNGDCFHMRHPHVHQRSACSFMEHTLLFS